jgi:membrane associated rhomboid family serine protease
MRSTEEQPFLQEVRASAAWILGFVGLLWGIELVNVAFGNRLLAFGILPRDLVGLRGIIFAPFLHGSFAHLLANSVPLLVLGSLVLLSGRGAFFRASAIIAVVGGGLTWAFGRSAYHVGASGLIFGYLGFLVAKAWYERQVLSILIAVFAGVLYGGILWGVLPLTPGVSWEGHIFGFLAGLLAGRDGAVRQKPAAPTYDF